MSYYNVRSGSTMYLDHIKEDNEIRAKSIVAKIIAKWKSQGGRRHIEGSYGPPVRTVKAEQSSSAVGVSGSNTVKTSSSSNATLSAYMPASIRPSLSLAPTFSKTPDRFQECAEDERFDNYDPS